MNARRQNSSSGSACNITHAKLLSRVLNKGEIIVNLKLNVRDQNETELKLNTCNNIVIERCVKESEKSVHENLSNVCPMMLAMKSIAKS